VGQYGCQLEALGRGARDTPHSPSPLTLGPLTERVVDAASSDLQGSRLPICSRMGGVSLTNHLDSIQSSKRPPGSSFGDVTFSQDLERPPGSVLVCGDRDEEVGPLARLVLMMVVRSHERPVRQSDGV
jgi:hypothetical protein